MILRFSLCPTADPLCDLSLVNHVLFAFVNRLFIVVPIFPLAVFSFSFIFRYSNSLSLHKCLESDVLLKFNINFQSRWPYWSENACLFTLQLAVSNESVSRLISSRNSVEVWKPDEAQPCALTFLKSHCLENSKIFKNNMK